MKLSKAVRDPVVLTGDKQLQPADGGNIFIGGVAGRDLTITLPPLEKVPYGWGIWFRHNASEGGAVTIQAYSGDTITIIGDGPDTTKGIRIERPAPHSMHSLSWEVVDAL